MPRSALTLAFGLVLAVLCPVPAWAWFDYYDGPTPMEVEADEYEALVTALDELGLDLDSPELDGMDEGEVWGYIERRRREKGETI